MDPVPGPKRANEYAIAPVGQDLELKEGGVESNLMKGMLTQDCGLR